MVTTVGEPPVRATRRRGRVLEDAILDAAWLELGERGWAGFTIDGVALRSGTAKSVIYRRWSSRVDLARAMLARATAERPAAASSQGELRADLLGFVRGLADFLRSSFGPAVRGVIHEGDQPGSASLFTAEATVPLVRELVEQAFERGEIATRPTALVLNLGHAVVMSEFLHTREAPVDSMLVELVDTVWLPVLARTAHDERGIPSSR